MELALILLVITLLLIFIKPRYMGYSAVLMAFIAFRIGVVNIKDVIEVIDIVWDATLTFIGIIILSLILEEIGFFEWWAIKIAKLSRGNGILMFVYSMLIGAFISAFLTNDSAALILTPILLSKMKMLKVNIKTLIAFMFAGGFIADSASLPFIFSNLTNIITADFFYIGFIKYFLNMFLPFLVSVVVSIFVLWFFFRKDIPKKIDIELLPDEKRVIKNQKLFIFIWIFLVILFIGLIIGDLYHIPVSIFALGGAILFLIITFSFKEVDFFILKKAPWQILFFSIGLYVIVFGLENTKIMFYLKEIVSNANVLQVGFLSGFMSGILNNLPTVMIMDLALKGANAKLIYANIIGTNIGAKLTPLGTLSTLIWLDILNKKGVKITFFKYIKFGFIITPIVLFLTLLVLYL